MLRNTLTIAWRTLMRNRGYALLNVAGLAVGLALAFVLGLWVADEMRTGRLHDAGDRLVRVLHALPSSDGTVQTWWSSPLPLAEVAAREVPGVEAAVPTTGGTWAFDVRHGGARAVKEDGMYVGANFFTVFDGFRLVEGDAGDVLAAPNAVAISEALARRHFGPDGVRAAVGQALAVGGEAKTVTGVFADVPAHATRQFDLVMPMAVLAAQDNYQAWGNFNTWLHLLLAPEADPERVEEQLLSVFGQYNEAVTAGQIRSFTHPVADMHLYGRFENGTPAGGRIEYVRLFAIVAVVVLVIAAVNFMNLATARAEARAREIGVRKAVGSGRAALAAQFLGESVLVALVALAVAAGLVALLLPAASALTGKALVGLAMRPVTLLAALGVTLVTGLASGSYPALYLSSFRPARILRGHGRRHAGAARFRKGLVVFQFALSILLVVGTLTAYRQVQFIQTKHLGLDRENVVATSLDGDMAGQFDAVRQQLLSQPSIQGVTRADTDPLQVGNATGDVAWPGKADGERLNISILNVDAAFAETMRLEVVAGRDFGESRPADSLAFLVNEAAAKAMGLEEPVGTPLAFWGQEAPIVGVVKDFHFRSMHTAIEPLVIRLEPGWAGQLLVRAAPGQAQAAVARLEAVHAQFAPEAPFDYAFLDARFDAMYRSEQVVSQLAHVFAGVAVFIACLGLFGLAASAAEQRTKEIGIRKALGASVASLFALFSSDFLKLVALAFVVATPVAYLVAERWLAGFAYRIDLGPGVFLAAGALALAVALATVSVQALRTARADPVAALRSE